MKIGVLGTGTVGKTIASRLIVLGHSVTMGSRTADNPAAVEWAEMSGENAHHGTFADAAAYGEMLVNATSGGGSLAAVDAAGAENLRGKIIIDVSNALDFSHGMPPSLSVCNTDSLGEQLQRAHPEAKVVKSLNTMNCEVQVDPLKVPGSHNVFLSGDDAEAKVQVAGLLHSFGWPRGDIIDLGGITTARGVEMWLPLWLQLRMAFDTSLFNLKIAR
jgi:predicted dinucleotide-binding enzyme